MAETHFYSHGRYAGIGRRMVALIVDTVIVAIVVVPIGYAIQQLLDGVLYDGVDWLTASTIATLLYLGYFIILEGRSGATLGKRLLGLQVQRLHGGPCTMRESLTRNALRVIDGFPFFFAPGVPPLYLVGGTMIAYSPQRQRLGDWAANTVVVLASDSRDAKAPVSSSHRPSHAKARKRRK